jgi:uncharacterized protein
MNCPACRSDLSPVTIAGVTLDACQGGCGGIWFDRGELAFNPPALELSRWLDDLAGGRTREPDLTPRRRCPRCADSILMRHFSSASQAITVDECPTCAGIWLDSGELERIRSEHVSAEDRHRAVVKLFERGAVGERMALESERIAQVLPYATWRSRTASAAVFGAYVAIAALAACNRDSFLLALTRLARFFVVPVACIWFPEALGDFVGGRITKTSPRAFVWFLGWVVLLVPVLGFAFALVETVGMFR